VLCVCVYLPAPNKRHRVSCSLSVSRVGLETHKRKSKRGDESRRGEEQKRKRGEERVKEQEREEKEKNG
jgi:hypothetical protein